ncbi:hypothetical protein [Planctomycetes bacterium TBK1r]|uniref:TonB-dependent receptor n=1 Tax=Stieleria magnilauensis TaxID=2527963 RepID=UPI0011A1A9C7
MIVLRCAGSASAQVLRDPRGHLYTTNDEVGTNEADAEEDEENGEKTEAGETESSAVTLLERGKIAFNRSCVECHDAERSLSKQKSFDGWMRTIRRMAAMDDADIPSADFEPIAVFLTAEAGAAESSDDEADTESDDEDSENEEDATGGDASEDDGPDRALIEQGRIAFNSSCIQCHDAQRSLSKRKSFAGWMQTIRRMAAMDGAQVPSSSFRAIATYLRSQNEGSQNESGGDGESAAAEESVSPWSFSTTASTVWRGSSDTIETPGFFIDAWATADWQSEGPLKAKVTACTSCHSDRNTSGGFTLELVEASATLDLLSFLNKQKPQKSKQSPRFADECPFKAELKVGRFIVPFGAFSSMVHPGSLRTVTNPLMFDMGRRVDRSIRPVLMLPFSDEGVDLQFALAASNDWVATIDLFAVNGLQGNASGINFNTSRRYYDNNRRPDYGGRMTLGNNRMRLGFSAMAGAISDDPFDDPARYQMIGWDAIARPNEKLRFYFEYAQRRNFALTASDLDEFTSGYVAETEYRLWEPLSFVARLDNLERRSTGGDEEIDRVTWGFNVATPGGSLLLLNHEHWILPDNSDIDVIGVRWTATF